MQGLIVTADYRQFTKLAAAAHFSSCICFCNMPMATMILQVVSAIGVSHMLERSSSEYNIFMRSICQYYCLSTWHQSSRHIESAVKR